jgi:putative transposase
MVWSFVCLALRRILELIMHLGVRLLHRRYGVSAAAVCAVRHRALEPAGALGWRHRSPDRTVGVQQARNVVAALDESTAFRFLIRDRDAKFTRAFDDVWCSTDVEVIWTPVRAPNANAVAERWIGTVRRECLDQLLIVGSRQLVRLLRVYVEHYNRRRAHRSLALDTPMPSGSGETTRAPALRQLCRRDILGGLIHEYEWAA